MDDAKQASKEELKNLQQLVRDLATSGNSTDSSGFEAFDHIPYIITQVLQTSRQTSFNEQLTLFVTKKEQEIERICSQNYQEFIASIEQLMKVRFGTSAIRRKMIEVNSDIQDSGAKMVSRRQEILNNRQILVNLELTLEALQSCLFVLEICTRVTSQMESRKYFSTLRMLNDLSTTQLKLVESYQFSKLIHAWVPTIQEKVRIAALNELQDWFMSYVSINYLESRSVPTKSVK